jgi:ER-bound oxygenase mpaB/B'/Rubber oxygenase, catalytic domain
VRPVSRRSILPGAMSPALREIQTLDPARDHQRIVLLSMRQDFPFDSTRSLELALFRTYGSPRISRLLDRTGEFARDAQKRYDDTDLLVSEVIEYGYESDRGRAALQRMNQLHGRFDIPNDDFLYVLSTFLFEPMRWNARFGWRRLTAAEREAYFHFWREVGRRMGMREVPDDAAEFERFSRAYEADHFRYDEANARVGSMTREMFASWFPGVLGPFVRQAMYALMDDTLRAAFGFPKPWPLVGPLVVASMKCRAVLIRVLPRRRRPRLRTAIAHRRYPKRVRDRAPRAAAGGIRRR